MIAHCADLGVQPLQASNQEGILQVLLAPASQGGELIGTTPVDGVVASDHDGVAATVRY